MKRPHRFTAKSIDWEESTIFPDLDSSQMRADILVGQCPKCGNLIIVLRRGKLGKGEYSFLAEIESEQEIYPAFMNRPVEPEVPEPYRSDFMEACAVLNVSPKASAALSQRILQTINL